MAIRGNKADFYGTGWAFPLDAAGGRVATLSDEANIAQSILLILQTDRGERVMMPEFGCDLSRLVFAPDNQSTYYLAEAAVKRALSNWEPRIRVLDVTAAPDRANPACLLVSVDYIIRSKNSRQNLVYPFYLRGSS